MGPLPSSFEPPHVAASSVQSPLGARGSVVSAGAMKVRAPRGQWTFRSSVAWAPAPGAEAGWVLRPLLLRPPAPPCSTPRHPWRQPAGPLQKRCPAGPTPNPPSTLPAPPRGRRRHVVPRAYQVSRAARRGSECGPTAPAGQPAPGQNRVPAWAPREVPAPQKARSARRRAS